MAQHSESKSIGDAVELLKTNGFDGLAEAVTVLLNSAMVAERSEYLGAAPYERSAERTGYANGYKDKSIKTRLGTLALKVPQSRDGEARFSSRITPRPLRGYAPLPCRGRRPSSARSGRSTGFRPVPVR